MRHCVNGSYATVVHCLFERFVNMYLFSMFVNIHTCAFVLLFGTNCPYECRNNSQMFDNRRVILFLFAISFFPAVKLHVFGYWRFAWFIDFCNSWQGQGRILYYKVWKDNWTCTVTPVNIIYYIVALLQYEYTSKEIIISLIRP